MTETPQKWILACLTHQSVNSDSSNAELLGEFTVYASTHPGAENEAFNFVDHNTVRETWEQTWKAIAEYFGVEVEEPTKASRFKLEEYMKDKKPVWEAYVKKNGGDPKLFDYATWVMNLEEV